MLATLDIPVEIIGAVAAELEVPGLGSLALSCRRLHAIVNPLLYRRATRLPDVLCWAAERGKTEIVEKLLLAGVDPSAPCANTRGNHLFSINQSQGEEESGGVDSLSSRKYHVQPLREYHVESPRLDPRKYRPKVALRTCTAIHLAALRGLDHIIDLLLQHGADIDARSYLMCYCSSAKHGSFKSYENWTPLQLAILRGNVSSAKLLMSRGASLVAGGKDEERSGPVSATALHCVCATGNLMLAEAILGLQPNPSVRDSCGYTPLAWAFGCQQLDLVEWLVNRGADIDIVHDEDCSLLLGMCTLGQWSRAHWLVQHGANVEFREAGSQNTALHCCFQQLLMSYSCPCIRDWPRCNAPSARLDLIRALLERGADANARTHDNKTPLMGLCGFTVPREDTPDIVEALLRHGARVNERSGSYSALDILCMHRESTRFREPKAATIDVLLRHGACPDGASEDGTGPLYSLFLQENMEGVRLVLAHGARPPPRSCLAVMLRRALEYRNPEWIALVLGFGEDARQVARGQLVDSLRIGNPELAELLLDSGMSPDDLEDDSVDDSTPSSHSSSRRQWTTLHHVCACLPRDYPSAVVAARVVLRLLLAGADPNVRAGAGGDTPLSIAVDACRVRLVETLLDHGADPDHPGGPSMRAAVDALLPGRLPPPPGGVVEQVVLHPCD